MSWQRFMFNKVIKDQNKELEVYKAKILKYSNDFIAICVRDNLKVVEINDIMQTVANHSQHKQMNLTASELFKKEE